MSDLPVIDPQAIDNLRSLNPDDGGEFLREIVGIFLDDTPQRIEELDQSLAKGDTQRFTRAAHSIKGSSSNLGALLLRAAAEALEHHAKTKGLVGTEKLIQAIKNEYQRSAAELQALL